MLKGLLTALTFCLPYNKAEIPNKKPDSHSAAVYKISKDELVAMARPIVLPETESIHEADPDDKPNRIPRLNKKLARVASLSDNLANHTTAQAVKNLDRPMVINSIDDFHRVFKSLSEQINIVLPKLATDSNKNIATEIVTELKSIDEFIEEFRGLLDQEKAVKDNQTKNFGDINPNKPSLTETQRQLIKEWRTNNQDYLNQTGLNLELAEDPNDIRTLSLIFIQAEDIEIKRALLQYYWCNKGAESNVAELLKARIKRQQELAPNLKRGLFLHEQLFVEYNKELLNKLGFGDLTSSKANLATEEAFAKFNEALDTITKDPTQPSSSPKAEKIQDKNLDDKIQEYLDNEPIIATDESKKEKILRSFDKLLNTLEISLEGRDYKASTFKDLPQNQQEAILDWHKKNKEWITLTGIGFKLGEGKKPANEIDFKKFIELQYFDFLCFTKLMASVFDEEGNTKEDKVFEHAELTYRLIAKEIKNHPEISRGLLRHEAYLASFIAPILEKTGNNKLSELLSNPKFKHLNKPEHRKVFNEALVKFIRLKLQEKKT